MLFILVGQQLPAILEGLGDYSIAQILAYAALVYAAVLGARMLWFFTTPYLLPIFHRLLRNRYLRSTWQERLVMDCSGMRGALSLAAALAVPTTVVDGAPFPDRDLILFLTFAVILLTLVLQGLTLGPLIDTLRLKNDDQADKVMELETRLVGACAALDRLERLDDERVPPGAKERTREQYEERVRRYEAGIEAGGTTEEYAERSAAWRDWRREPIAAERKAILSLRDRGWISPEVMRCVMRDLDLEDSRIAG
jgi:NhaP-type Na+/H+ or K+/H+ antiporter